MPEARPLAIVGPTGAGKSDVAVELALRHGVDIVSMDAMQVYRGMDIGTAKLSIAERRGVPHRCIDVRDPDEAFTAADFAAEVESVGSRAILCGGTVFYLRAWRDPLVAAPPADAALRAAFEALPDPHARLTEVDPALAARLHPNDRVRIVRGLEVHALTGRPLSALHAADPKVRRPCEIVWIDRDDLFERLDARVDRMIRDGYLDEVRGLLDAGYGRGLKPMKSLGYAHLAAHLAGELSLADAIERTKTDTRQLARKQRMFLRGLGLSPGGDPVEAGRRALS